MTPLYGWNPKMWKQIKISLLMKCHREIRNCVSQTLLLSHKKPLKMINLFCHQSLYILMFLSCLIDALGIPITSNKLLRNKRRNLWLTNSLHLQFNLYYLVAIITSFFKRPYGGKKRPNAESNI